MKRARQEDKGDGSLALAASNAYMRGMKELFETFDAERPLDPNEAARRSMRSTRRRRVYQAATVGESDGGFGVLLDGKPVRTPARRPLVSPRRSIAEAIAFEWNGQGDTIDPATMPLTRLANAIVDGVAPAPQPVLDEIAKYVASDLVFYRADRPQGLVLRQAQSWDPLLAWARETLGARFICAEGVIYTAQPDTALAAFRAAIPQEPWALGALNSVTTLTGSALIALAVARGRLSVEEAWTAAHVDEDWNMEQWGGDAMALERRSSRFAEMQAAALVLDAMRK
jgi:chaperone required for assembly of F1-ATPase